MRMILVAAVALAASFPVATMAQDQNKSITDKINEAPDLTTKRDPNVAHKPYAGDSMARQLEHLIGQKVTNAQGQEIGDVENLLVRPDGKVAGLVVEWGGLAGLGANQVALPWSDVQLSQDGRRVSVNATREQLEQRPKYDPDVPANAGVDPDIKPLR